LRRNCSEHRHTHAHPRLLSVVVVSNSHALQADWKGKERAGNTAGAIAVGFQRELYHDVFRRVPVLVIHDGQHRPARVRARRRRDKLRTWAGG
jgi:hypothetical protein